MSTRVFATRDVAAGAAAPRPRLLLAGRRLLRDRVGIAGAAIIFIVAAAAVLAPWLAPADPTAMLPDQLTPPNRINWLGTDEVGRDVLSRLMHGGRVSLAVSVSSMTASALAGVGVGLAAGFYGGRLDGALVGVMDVIFAFPGILLALAIMAVLGTALQNLVLALAIVSLPSFARIARASTLSVRGLDYVEAARGLGARDRRILLRHVLPNIGAPVIVQYTIGLAFAILTEAGLSFIGLGVQPPAPSWGAMLSRGKDFLEISPWPAVFPGLAIMVTVLGFNFLGDSLRDVLDPRLRGSL
jgi:peptide/nickel transport system permease protein